MMIGVFADGYDCSVLIMESSDRSVESSWTHGPTYGTCDTTLQKFSSFAHLNGRDMTW
jgi:hypothetical protein